ncbi:DUF4352 domain-containing protein [Phytohabitans suffuscus]|uniref:DUF4352 domain-containing protein n=1 Tax=Phytohabitans suffuscus TaxID=624315 RepID=A0A6F8YDR6_9ACTN|nr:DUF4352 domain-containing protein [Phytohabitans suffuscus]BCB84246.1 hypothetical protein Psuf_015590 [Phytohabitans suffuscus]
MAALPSTAAGHRQGLSGPDGEAGIYGNKDGAGFLDEINPGNQVRAFVYFDVPKGTKLTAVVFDAGLFTLAEDAVVTL